MIKIGELAKICRVSVQTLRYYDKIGLLCADRVDMDSGYRYYAPEKVRMYQMIAHLKSLDFSLPEIKAFLNVPLSEQHRMYEHKKHEILVSIQNKREIIRKIDESCENPDAGQRSINEQIYDIPFADDPAVVGKWVYCGNMDRKKKFTGTEMLHVQEVMQENLYFLPGGQPVWTYFWTKGILYWILSAYNIVVPNEYRIFSDSTGTYMAVDFVSERIAHAADDTLRIYRQVDTVARTKRDAYEFLDDVNLPYIQDSRVLGEWETVDMIKDPAAFTANPDKWIKESIWIRGMQFFERGRCVKIGTAVVRTYHYTAGVILSEENETAEKYTFRQVNGEDYLITEHKSGDYSYLGKVFVYYVFRRKRT